MPEGSAELAVDHSFDAPLERVVAMYADVEFVRERGMSVGASECDVMVDGSPGDGFSVAIRRILPTDNLQPNYRPFLGSTVTIRYSEAWEPPDDGNREATFAVDIPGVPARATGSIRLTPEGTSTSLSLRGTVTTHVPFLAGVVTQAILDSLAEAIDRELETAGGTTVRPSPSE
jgi:hypothetical protein